MTDGAPELKSDDRDDENRKKMSKKTKGKKDAEAQNQINNVDDGE